jgi:uncharacterized Fe-S radical SAM superfamily protein PflX
MGQYRPEYEVGVIGGAGQVKYREINGHPAREEMLRAFESARGAGLWRFDERWQ